MALLKHSEFAEKCGISKAAISVNKKRNKIKLRDDGLIDDSDPVNRTFMKRQQENQKKKINKGLEAAFEEIPVKEVLNPVKREREINTSKSSNDVDDYTLNFEKKQEFDTEKASVMLEKARQELRLARMQEEKLLGKLIPTDVIKSLFGQHFKSVSTSFKQFLDIWLVEVVKKARLNRNEAADIRSRMIDELNRAVMDAEANSKKTIKAIVEEYSENKQK